MSIRTHCDPKPIPVRDFDWTAVDADYDAGDPVGYGPTEQDAIADLRALIPAGLCSFCEHDPAVCADGGACQLR